MLHHRHVISQSLATLKIFSTAKRKKNVGKIELLWSALMLDPDLVKVGWVPADPILVTLVILQKEVMPLKVQTQND